MEKILVLRGGALGDFIVTLPALSLLRDEWPRARIELAGNATAAQLAVNRGLINAAHSQHEARWARLYGNVALPAEFAAWLSEFNLVVSFWPDPDGELRRRFPVSGRQKFISASAKPQRNPAAAHYCAALHALGLRTSNYFHWLDALGMMPIYENMAPSGHSSARLRQWSDGPISKGAILVHPGSGSPEKNWPQENWLALIAQLSHPVALILGDAETPKWRDVISANQRSGSKPLCLVNSPLENLVTEFAECPLFVGHDSGISHLAAASGAKCVLLFGPTDPACWAPPAPNVRVLRNRSDLASLSVDAVRAAVVAALADRT